MSKVLFLGLRSTVADLSASERTIIDGSATSLDYAKVMVPLVGNQVARPVFQRREIHLFFVILTDLDRHLDQHHMDARIQWGCIYCERSFPKLHGAKCHIPKCSGMNQRKEGAYKCGACHMIFGTQTGLSTHERHAHPALREEGERTPRNGQ